MTLEAVVFQQDPYSFSLLERPFSYEIFDYNQNVAALGSISAIPQSSFSSAPLIPASIVQTHAKVLAAASASPSPENNFSGGGGPSRRRRRTRSEKNREEIENQRMTHIAVERKRRKQMNDRLSVLKSMMPPSYAQRGDQASIVGGAVNFLKELEQLLQSLEAQKRIKTQRSPSQNPNSSSVFSDFFIFPQFSTTTTAAASSTHHHCGRHEQPLRAAVADVEVTMVEGHANIKVLTKAQPRHLFKMVSGLYSLGLSILHLNLTTCQNIVLYTLSVKVEEACQMTSVNEIASEVHELVRRIQDEN